MYRHPYGLCLNSIIIANDNHKINNKQSSLNIPTLNDTMVSIYIYIVLYKN